MTTSEKQHHPVFDEYRIWEIMRDTGYSGAYLETVRSGGIPASPLFRRKVAAALNRPQAELFLPAATGQGGSA